MRYQSQFPDSRFAWAAFLFLASLSLPASQAIAQTPAGRAGRVVPPPPRIAREPASKGVHRAEQGLDDPERAFDSETSQNLFWDCVRNTWVDAKTGKPLGFQGARGKNGEVIPPPPRIAREPASRGVRQAEQSLDDPARAFDSEAGQNLFWDDQAKTWKDAKTGKPLGFQGARVAKPCPPVTEPRVAIRPEGTGSGNTGLGRTFTNRAALLKYERRNFYNWEKVSGNNPSVASNTATSSTNGAGAFVGAKLGDLPAWGMVGGYYAGGLSTVTKLKDGRRIQGNVNDYALGTGFRLLFGERRRISPWAWLAGFYEWNVGTFDEFSVTNALLSSTRRTHKSFTGEYGVGATYWVQPRIGLDLGLSYNGQFNNRNADENLRVGVGVIVSGTDNMRR